MERFYQLSYTPTFALSLLIESEDSTPSFIRLAARFLLYSRSFYKATPLREALENELSIRPLAEAGSLISSTTLRVVDNAYYISRRGNFLPDSWIISAEDITTILSSKDTLSSDEQTLLATSVERVLLSYSLASQVVLRSQVPTKPEDDDERLLELFSLLKPNATLSGLTSKQWQDIGFQNNSPYTDFRALNVLALDSILFFAKEYGTRAVEIVEESVEGGEHWYPLALASIHMTSFALSLATSRDLQLLLLRHYQTAPESFPLLTTNPDRTTDLTPFLRLASELLVLFHENWLRKGYTVMQFEAVSKEFQESLKPWIRRGIIDGRALGWSRQSSIEGTKKKV